MWCYEESLLRRLIHKHRNNLIFQVGKKVRDYAGMDAGVRKIINMLPSLLDRDNDFWENNIDTSQHKLLFSNGILDMDTMQFTNGFNPNIVFADRIDRPYNPNVNPEVRAKVLNMIFNDPFTREQIRQGVHIYQQKALGRTLAGDYRSRLSYFNIGETSAGKGLITDAAIMSSGTYFGTFNIKSLMSQPNSSMDAAKQLSWVADITYKRGAFSNEPPRNVPLDGCLFKLVISGGDVLVIRQNRENEYCIRIRCTFWFMANDMPKIVPNDDAVKDRIHGVVGYNVRFKDVVSGLNPDKEKLKDKTAKDFFHNVNAQDAMLDIMLEGYQLFLKEGHERCADVLKSTEEWVDVENGLLALMEGKYAITGSEDDYVTFPELKEFFDKKGLGFSSTKLGLELIKIEGVNKKDKKVNGHKQRVYTGIVALQRSNENFANYRFDF
jgi:phage/plasmid-associated DNA primase